MFDKIAQLFGGRNESCKLWDEYVEKTSAKSEIKASVEKIKKLKSEFIPANDEVKNEPESINVQANFVKHMPLNIQLSADINELRSFIDNNNISEHIEQQLENRIKTAEKIENLAKNPVKPNCHKPTVIGK